MSPEPVSTVLSAEQEAIAVAFRRHTLLTLDDYCKPRVRSSAARRYTAVFSATASAAGP